MKCEQCGEEFEAKRSDARFCGSACRKAFSRVTDNVSGSVTDKFRTWADLPPDVQRKIEWMSRAKADEGICDYEVEKAERTQRSLSYLNQFPQYAQLRGAF